MLATHFPTNHKPRLTDEVDTSKLLPSLHQDTSPCPEAVPALVVLEAVRVAAGVRLQLNSQRSGDLQSLGLDFGRVMGKRHQSAKSVTGFGLPVLEKEVARRFGEHHLFLDSVMDRWERRRLIS
jgi:hypothetical protein